MRLGYEIVLRQEQRLVMTPELRQAITVLQLPTLDLLAYIEAQMQENPVLEYAEELETTSDGPDDGYGDAYVDAGEGGAEAGESLLGESLDIDWRQYFSDRSDLGIPRASASEEEREGARSSLRWEPTLYDHLLVQLELALPEGPMRSIGKYLLGCIDDDGYLRVSPEDVAAALGQDPELVRTVASVIKTFDPPGVGARDLAECLLIQLESRASCEALELAKRIVSGHLDDLAAGRITRIASELGVMVAKVQEAIDLIRKCDPKPARGFAPAGTVRYIVPDVFIHKVDSDYVVTVNDTAVPRLMINNFYKSIISSPSIDQTAADFIKGKLNAAVWLIRSLEQRRMTILKVAESILKFQRDFFDYGIKHLRPLTMKEVADDIGMHESTVSRAATGKYAQTPRGTFELRAFFTSGVSTADGDAASSASIKRMIREIVDAEDPRRPLSDQAIAERLRACGILISRRTVAKYREEIRIPASSKRRRYD